MEYKPVTDYTAVVRAFQRGDIHLAWMGGLTGVQARALVPDAQAVVQRDIDADFHSLFIANRSAGLRPFTDVSGLTEIAGQLTDVRQRDLHLRPADAAVLHAAGRGR